MNINIHKYRSSLARGASAIAMTLLLFCGTGCHNNKSTDSKVVQPITTEVTSTKCTTTTTTTTTSTTTTTTSTTTTETTTSRTETTTTQTQTIVVVTETEPVYISEPVIEPVYTEQAWTSEDDVILLAKLINHEASATYEGKVMVGSCVVNRMNIKGMSVSEVIFEPYQFTTASSLTNYTDADYQAAQQVLTQGSVDTRIFYFDGCHPDGLNHFRDINDNYLGAW